MKLDFVNESINMLVIQLHFVLDITKKFGHLLETIYALNEYVGLVCEYDRLVFDRLVGNVMINLKENMMDLLVYKTN